MSSIFTSSLFISFVRDDIRHNVLFVCAGRTSYTPLIVTVNLESVRRKRMQRVAMQHVENSALA